MADGVDDVFPEHLDPEIKARFMPTASSGFRFDGSIRPESSLMLFVRRRASRYYVGFVDAVSMAPVTLPQNRGVRVLNAVVNPPVGKESTFLEGHLDEQLKYLCHTKHGRVAQQLLLTETLPQHEYKRNLGNLSDCLNADSPAVRRDALSRLERLIIVSKDREISAFKNQLLRVAQRTYDVINDTSTDDTAEYRDHVRMCGHLHLVALSALLCRANHRPTLDECRPFMSWPKLNKKQSGCDVREEVLKMLNAFYECIERHLKESKSKMGAPLTSDRKKFIRADFCDQASSLFLILNKIATTEEQEWADKDQALLEELKEVCWVIDREGRRLKPEVKAGLNTLLVRSLVILLNSTFAKVRQEVGEVSYDHPVKIAELLASVTQKFHPRQIRYLLPHLSTIAFHESPAVRHIITELLDNLHQHALHTSLHHLETSLAMADFQVDHPKNLENVCAWHTLKGHFGSQTADCHVLAHAGQCKAKRSSSSECADHPGGQEDEEWEQHRRSMETLVKLSAVGHSADAGVKGSGHNHHYKNPLVQLLAYQSSPYLFYATESVKGRRLLEHLINHRTAHRWLSISVLSHVIYDVISGLEFLATKHIASREVTSCYMLVDGRSRRGGVSSEKMDVLTMDDFSVKLTNLGLAHQFRGEQDRRRSIRPVETQGPIPLLWTSPEALVHGEYSEMSMVYSAGCVMYELWTHGCQPFTTYQTTSADTVRMMLLRPDSTPLVQWPCIPDEVYSIMCQCTLAEPSSRPSLASLKQTFMEMHTRQSQSDQIATFNPAGKEQGYPSFSDDQVKRRHFPERGIPPEVQQIIEVNKKKQSESYRNMRRSRWEMYAAPSPANAASELNSSYWIQFAYLENYTSVRERFSPSFVKNEFPLLEKRTTQAQDHLAGVTTWMTSEDNQPTLEEESQDHIVHERHYKPAWTLQDVACKGLLATTESGYISMAMERYLHVLLSLARALHELHQAGWLHRDLRASNILVDCQSGEITLARLGRMCQVRSPTGSVQEEPFEDSWRWLAPEVLSEGQYTRESDVFMFGTVVWEIFWSREVTERNPTATEMNCVPFANHPKENILNLVRMKKNLKKPEACPNWLYQLSVNCRDPDPALRPATVDIVITLEGEMIQKPDLSRRFLVHPKLLVAAHERCSEVGLPVPELPARFKAKHARPFRDSGIEDAFDEPLTPARRPINLSSIILSPNSTIQEESSEASAGAGCMTPSSQKEKSAKGSAFIGPGHANADCGYLTPVSEEVKSVAALRSGQSGPSSGDFKRRSSETDAPKFPGNDLRSQSQGRSSSEGDLSPHIIKLGFNFERKDATWMRGGVFRKFRGYPSGRGLPPVPSEEEEDDSSASSEHSQNKTDKENVYDEI